jgi:hypothetical protein
MADESHIVVELGKALISGVFTLAAVGVGTALAAARFHAEKRWARKEAAYAELLGHLQNLHDVFSANWDRHQGHDTGIDEKAEREISEKAFNFLVVQRAIGAWHLSEETLVMVEAVQLAMEELNARLERKEIDVLEWNQKGRSVVVGAMTKIRAYAKAELDREDDWWAFWR